MKTQHRFPDSPYHVKPRADGVFVVFDKDQKFKFKAATPEEAQRWIAEHTGQPHKAAA